MTVQYKLLPGYSSEQSAYFPRNISIKEAKNLPNFLRDFCDIALPIIFKTMDAQIIFFCTNFQEKPQNIIPFKENDIIIAFQIILNDSFSGIGIDFKVVYERQ